MLNCYKEGSEVVRPVSWNDIHLSLRVSGSFPVKGVPMLKHKGSQVTDGGEQPWENEA